MPAPMSIPTLDQENRLWQSGVRHIAGVDEAGRGALAGPVVAAAVILPPAADYRGVWNQVRDSKQLPAASRETLAVQIQESALAWSVGAASSQEIDGMGIAPATRLAMDRAIAALQPPPDYLLLDWVRLPHWYLPQQSFVRGDGLVVSIAAASILAKVHRDRLLVAWDAAYPGYGFAAHKGYGTPAHLTALDRHGPCSLHRQTFAPIARRPTLFEAHGTDPEETAP
jgi:ribonuclease HII